MSGHSQIETVRALLAQTLGAGTRVAALDADARLLGALPELDSMSIVHLLAAIEAHYGFSVDDDELDADAFATLGALAAFIEAKLAAADRSKADRT